MMFESCLGVSDNKNVHCKVVMLIIIMSAWYSEFAIAFQRSRELLKH